MFSKMDERLASCHDDEIGLRSGSAGRICCVEFCPALLVPAETFGTTVFILTPDSKRGRPVILSANMRLRVDRKVQFQVPILALTRIQISKLHREDKICRVQ